MSENQYLEIIENKLDAVTQLIEQQSKSGVFFDGFTKQVLEKIHNKLEYISNFETNELITYLTEELKRSLEDRHNVLQQRFDSVQGQINNIQTNLADSLKSPEVAAIFTKLSDTVLDFSRDLNSQTKYFNSTVEDIQNKIAKIDIQETLGNYSEQIKTNVENYHNNVKNLATDINYSFTAIKNVIEKNTSANEIVALAGDISVLQKGLNDVISSVLAINAKQGDIITAVADISSSMDVQDIRLDVSSLIAEIQALKDALRVLVNKSDIEALNERVQSAIESLSNFRELSVYNNDENKNILKTYFNDLNNLLSTLVSKEESELIKNQLEYVRSTIVSGKEDIQSLIEQSNIELKNLIPVISSLSTRENIKELSNNTVQSISYLTEQFNDKIKQTTDIVNIELDKFNTNLSDVLVLVDNLSSKLDSVKEQHNLSIKDEVQTLFSYLSSLKEQITEYAENSLSSLDGKFNDKLDIISSAIQEKISNLEPVINATQSGIKNELTESLAQLKEFSQNLINVINVIEKKIDAKNEEIGVLLENRYGDLSEKISNLHDTYVATSADNKKEIIDNFGDLKVIIDATKSLLGNNDTYNLLNDKISALQTLLENNENEIKNIGYQTLENTASQSSLIQDVQNCINNLTVNIDSNRDFASENKNEIINELSQKIFNVTSNIEDLKGQINWNIASNKEAFSNEINSVLSDVSDIKSILDVINQNQASKEILAAILENVTSKLEQVSTLILETKDFNLEQYDCVKNLTNNLKNDFGDVLILLNQSAEFSNVFKQTVVAGFSNVIAHISEQTNILREDFSNISATQKEEIVGQFEKISSQIMTIQSQINSFKFDEIMNEQLDGLRQQIESFNQQLLETSFDKVIECGQENKNELIEVVNSIKTDFDNVINNIDLIQVKSLEHKDELKKHVYETINDIDQKLNIFVQNVDSNLYSNKQQILDEILNMVETINNLRLNVENVQNTQIKSELVVEQTDKLSNLINYFGQTIKLKLDTIENNDKDYISDFVSKAFEEFKQQIEESINYLKSLNLNLDRSFNTVKNDILDEVVVLKTTLNQNSDKLDCVQNEVVSNGTKIIDTLEEKFEKSELQRKENKDELLAKVAESELKLSDKFSDLESKGQMAKDEVLSAISSGVKDLEEKLNTSEIQQKSTRNEILSKIGDVVTSLSEKFTQTFAQKHDDTIAKVDDIPNMLATNTDSLKNEISTELQTTSKKVVEEISLVAETIKTIGSSNKLEILTSFNNNKEALNDNLNSAIENIQNLLKDDRNSLSDEISILQNSLNQLNETAQNIEGKLLKNEDISAEVEKIEKSLQIISDKISLKLDELVSRDSSDDFAKISSALTNLKNDISVISSLANQNKMELIDAIKEVNNGLELELKNNSEKINEFMVDIRQVLENSVLNIEDLLLNGKDNNEELKMTLKQEFKTAIFEITNIILKTTEENSTLKSDLLYELQKAYNALLEKIDNQTEKTSAVKSDIIETLNDDITGLKETFNKNCETLQTNIIKDVVNEISFDDVKTEISKNISDSIIELQNSIQSVSNDFVEHKDVFTTLSKNNCEEILNNISEIKSCISEIKFDNGVSQILPQLKTLSSKIDTAENDILAALSNDLNSTLSEHARNMLGAVEDKISFIKDDIQEIIIKVSDFDSVVDIVKDTVILAFEHCSDTFTSKIDKFEYDVKNLISESADKVSAEIQQYRNELNSLADIDLSGYSEDTKRFVEEQIDTLKAKVDELTTQTELNHATQSINETVISSSNNINKRLEIIRDIILSEMPSSDELFENLDDVRADLDEIKQKTMNFEEVVKTENSSLKDVIARYQKEIEEISKIDLSSYQDETQGFIKDELKQLKEQFVRNLTSVFENISFIEESEEIQNVILDNADDIKNEIIKLKNDLTTNSNSTDDIDEKFENLKNILESITTGTTGNNGKYIYTLPDVETDIAKMRMAISEVTDMIKRNKEEGYEVAERLDTIDDIREDISSISKRTNKLILTSEDANKHLKENIAEFKKIINDVNEKCNHIDSTQLNRNIADVKSLVMSGLKSDKILNEAFMHLAEWIDDSARTMNIIDSQVSANKHSLVELKNELKSEIANIDTKTDDIAKLKDIVSDLTYKLDKKTDIDYSKSLYEIEYALDKLSDKFDVQELKIKALEKKIDSIGGAQSGNEEITSLLEYIASQVSAANENSRNSKLLMQKIEMMEKQMNKFENSISKITQFVDDAE